MPLLRSLALQALVLSSITTAYASEVATPSEVATLNRVTFNGNVFANKAGEGPEGWVVLFCAPWFEPCQKFQKPFVETAAKHGGTSHDDLFSRNTRFAHVDCAVDKVLCNSQDVDAYPTVVHYRRGGRAGEWSQSGRRMEKEAASFVKWATKQMQKLDTPIKIAVADEGPVAEPVAKLSSDVVWEQALPMLVMAAASCIWLRRFSNELWHGIQLLKVPSEPLTRMMKKEAKPEEPQLPPAVVRCLPEAWGHAASEL